MERQMDKYLFLSSGDSPIHPGNTANDFTVELPHLLDLKGDWECALIDTHRRHCIIYCDLCEYSIIGEEERPILRRVGISIPFPLYVCMREGCYKRIRIYLDTTADTKRTDVVLHLRRIYK